MPWDEAVAPTLVSNAGEKPLPDQAGGHASGGAAALQYAWAGAWVVAARGAYDMDSITPLAEALETAARKHPKVILDASCVTFADSAFLNLLILTHQAGTLRVVAPSQQVRRLCEITGVDHLLEIRATIDEAAAS
ncbi:anti-sigma factor antagonist [Streptomyces viridochromogenes DSM 40736]|uniref:Anti-sigma factor antagonist n=1 Tax=Streptomyces viridochromogenes (strain DSM 40736 / JCM 4977 / BCRC 1201 / Tue 494) TaxID=591159 RepID=D9XGG9_STRVT|nr:STAS domain-containing protein [Streptomyces viridochromogenes]EFL37058.1 anti-sigma factor antagonist [Streptomyces viridochromogenes DSM 40736]